MKALSLKQPWAELVVSGRKKIELRKWNTKFRGEFLIHASKVPDSKSMKRLGFEKLPCGVIVGKARLVGVKKYANKKEFEEDKNLHFGTEGWGEYGFLLKDAKKVRQIPVNGKLGFWNFS
ncbi:ASCH domain-containing protein [Nanoarchaeota archaeon]